MIAQGQDVFSSHDNFFLYIGFKYITFVIFICVSIWLILFHIHVHYEFSKIFASSKKRDLNSEQSEAGDDTKKMREDSSTTSFSENDDVFQEGLKSDDCRRILANCFKNIQEKIDETFCYG